MLKGVNKKLKSYDQNSLIFYGKHLTSMSILYQTIKHTHEKMENVEQDGDKVTHRLCHCPTLSNKRA